MTDFLTSYSLKPIVTESKVPDVLLNDSSTISNNPILKVLLQQKQIAIAQTATERALLLPDLSIGYLNNSFRGTGADNKNYTASTRFNSVQVGVGIPIFQKAQKAKITASRLQENILQSQYDAEILALRNQYQRLLSQYTSRAEIVKYFEDAELKNATVILQTANRQFVNGEINYLDYVMLTNQAISIQSNYIEALEALTESVIAISFLTSKSAQE